MSDPENDTDAPACGSPASCPARMALRGHDVYGPMRWLKMSSMRYEKRPAASLWRTDSPGT